jgi:hypothetical protein
MRYTMRRGVAMQQIIPSRLMAIIFLPFVEEKYKFKKMNIHA